MKKPMKLCLPEAASLTEFDWNFDGVPDDELVACVIWEYARESAFIRDVKRRCIDPQWRKMHNPQLWQFVGNDIERIQSIGYASEVFLRGFFFDKAEDRRLRHPEAPPITGSFPAPWQSLGKAERKCRSRIRTDREVIPLVPFDRGYSFMAEWIAEHCRRQRYEAERGREEILRQHSGLSEIELCKRRKLRCPDIRPSIFTGGAEVGVFNIHWGNFTNEELRTGFYRWLKANRPHHLPQPDGRGRKTISWRVSLEQLGILRLLHRFALAEIKMRCPEAWRRYARPNRRWERDATKACARFRQLFPFLDPSDQPLSLPRKAKVAEAE